jgi:hypothetical protein
VRVSHAILHTVSSFDFLRRRTQRDVLALSPRQRIELAFALGEDDLSLFMRVSGLSRAAALARLRAARQAGRLPSRSAGPPVP